MGWMVPMMAAAQQRQGEERLLAELIAKDEKNAYEFKILHAYGGAFRRPERLRQILEDERQARWELVMKLDDTRIVLRRPRQASYYESSGGVDPYRTQIGSNRAAVALVLGGVLALGIGVAILFAGERGAGISGEWPIIAASIVSIIIFLLLVMIKATRAR